MTTPAVAELAGAAEGISLITTPVPVLYASVADLRLILASTDAGVGTADQLSDEQLALAIRQASSRVSVYFGAVYDSSTQQAVPPPLAQDVTLDLAVWYATTYYLKQKDMPPTSPVMLRYTEAMKVLDAVRAGQIDPATLAVGQSVPGGGTGHVINGLPATVFTPEDSNTDVSEDTLFAAVPVDMWMRPRTLGEAWIEYQG